MTKTPYHHRIDFSVSKEIDILSWDRHKNVLDDTIDTERQLKFSRVAEFNKYTSMLRRTMVSMYVLTGAYLDTIDVSWEQHE